MLNYTCFTIRAKSEDVERICDILTLFETGGFAVSDPHEIQSILESGEVPYDYVDEKLQQQSDEAAVQVYLPDSEEGAKTCREIMQVLTLRGAESPFSGPIRYETEKIDLEAYENAWKEYFHPTRVSKRLVVCPSWEEYNPKHGEVVMTLDPGIAFGSGTHETTRLCIGALDDLVRSGTTVLDVGCGSGILSIAALLLGADSAFGCDIDEGAVKTARENAARNGVADRFICQKKDLLNGVTGCYTVVVANIVADVIIRMLPDTACHLEPGGSLILSGIITAREADVVRALEENGFEVVERRSENDWVMLRAGLKNPEQMADKEKK